MVEVSNHIEISKLVEKTINKAIEKLENFKDPEAKISDYIILHGLTRKLRNQKEKVKEFIKAGILSSKFSLGRLGFYIRDVISKDHGVIISFFTEEPEEYDFKARVGEETFYVKISPKINGWGRKIHRKIILGEDKCIYEVYERKFVPVERIEA